MADWREGITVGSGLGDLGNTNLTQEQKRDILQRVLGVRDLGATGSQPLPSRPTPLWSLEQIFRMAPELFTPGEGKEDKRYDILGNSGLPESAVGRLMASEAMVRNESKMQPGWRPTTFQESGLEALFRKWAAINHLNFDPSNPFPDYDLRAWFEAMRGGKPTATFNVGIGQQGQPIPLFPPNFTTPYSLDFTPQSDFWNKTR